MNNFLLVVSPPTQRLLNRDNVATTRLSGVSNANPRRTSSIRGEISDIRPDGSQLPPIYDPMIMQALDPAKLPFTAPEKK